MKRVLKLRKKYIILLAILLLVVSGGLFLSKNKAMARKVDINKVLETDDYSYLPDSAKFYIQKMYKKTGTIVLTEKNKKDGVPYLNPKYVDYLEADEEERAKYSLVPNNVIVDYKYNKKIYKSATNPNLPAKYDLRDYGYVSPVKNQGMLDLCWAFSANSQLESLLLKKGITATFSERQLDYATSSNGINNYVSEYNVARRVLGGGGNYVGAIVPMMNGVSTVASSSFPYNENSFDKKELYEVLNFGNAGYEVNGGINMVTLDPTTATEAEINSYIDIVKTKVMEYGGTFVGTTAPNSDCGYYDENKDTYLIRDDGVCNVAPHGMHIIGWDDDYEYSYCSNNGVHEKVTASCPQENVVSGKGAWLIKNSWGDGYPYTYVYLAYDSMDTTISLVTDVTPASQKTWDNVYSVGKNEFGYFENYTISNFGNIETSFSNINEKLEKVKFVTLTENGKYKVMIEVSDPSSDYGTKTYQKVVETTLPGLQTVDFSDLNINITDDSAVVTISSSDIVNGEDFFALPYYVYTSNKNNNVRIKTDDVVYRNSLSTQAGDDYKVAVYSETRNIPSNALLDYKLYDSEDNEISITYVNNYVAENNAMTTIIIPKTVVTGEYTLKTMYDGVEYTSSIVDLTTEVGPIEGSGTKQDPYLIKTAADLSIINEDLTASYALVNDLDFKGALFKPIGVDSDKGFTGTFDGRGHTIKDLSIDHGVSDESVGIFSGIVGNDKAPVEISNLVLENIRAYGNYDSLIQGGIGILAGVVSDCNDDYICGLSDIKISNISLINDSTVETGLVGMVLVSKENGVSFNDIYLDSKVYYHRGFTGGLISFLSNVSGTNGSALIKNVQDVSLYADEYLDGYGYSYNDLYNNYYLGTLVGYLNGDVNISNYISNANYVSGGHNDDNTYKGLLVGMYEGGNLDISNSYYVNENQLFGNDSNYVDTGVEKKDAIALTDSSLYTSWADFSEYWYFNNDNDVNRMPVLIDARNIFKYTDIPQIQLVVNQELPIENIFNYAEGDKQARWDHGVTVKEGNEVIELRNNKLVGLKRGTAVITVYSKYDGYSKDIELNVTDDSYFGTVTFNSNLEPNTTEEQEISLSDKNLKTNPFTKTGYKLKEWNTKASGDGTSYADKATLSAEDFENEKLELFAIWEPIKYQVNYIYEGIIGSDNFTYDDSKNLTEFNKFNVEIQDGYKFDYWTFAEDESKRFTDGQEVVNLAEVDNQELYLIAHIKPIEYTVRFNDNNGTGNTSEENYAYTDEISLPEQPSRKGYKFKEWNIEADGSGLVIAEGANGLSNIDGSTVDVYAVWEPIKYTIRFKDEDEEKVQEFTYDVAQQLAEYTFTKTGWTFDGWISNGVNYFADQSVLNLTDKEEELIFEACYGPNSYTLIYDANTGTGEMDTVSLAYDEEYKLDKNLFTKTGHQFDSWNTKADGTGDSYDDEDTIVNLSAINGDEVTLYAQWAPAGYKIEFNANGGEGTMKKQTFYYDKEDNLVANAFTKTGYTFKEWNTKADGTGDRYTNGQAILNLVDDDSTVILYAQWTPIKYTVTFNSNDGEGSMESQEFTYDEVGHLNENTFTRNHYNFVGWNTSSNGDGTSYEDGAEVKNLASTTDATVTLYAQWEVIKFTVTFDSNGGEGEMSDQVFTYVKQALSTNLFERTGYVFDSWNIRADGEGTKYENEAEIVVDDNITLYAQWRPISYTVQFDSNGGSGTIDSIPVTYGNEFNMPANSFTKTGYKFKNWNSKADGTGTDYEESSEALNLTEFDGDVIIIYAQWEAINYTVMYDGNTGNGSMESVTHAYGEEFALSENAFTKTGYSFKEWNTQADGEGTAYTDKQTVSNLKSVEGNITLYAIWEPIEYIVHFDLAGGTGNIEDVNLHYGEAFMQGTIPTKTGYTFKEWNTKEDGTGTSYNDKTEILNLTDTSETVTLYAIYTANTYTVKFDGNGGEGSMSDITCTYGEECQLPENAFTKVEGEGEEEVTYEIKEWNTKADGSGDSYKNNAKVTTLAESGSVTLYVIWRVEVAYEIKNYEVDDDNDITLINKETLLNDYIGNFEIGNKYSIKVYRFNNNQEPEELGEDDFVGTGTKTIIYLGIDPVAEFYNIVRGDIDGDGYIDIADVAKLYRHIKDRAPIRGDNYLKAAEIDGYEGYNIGDVSKLYRFIKGKVSTLY